MVSACSVRVCFVVAGVCPARAGRARRVLCGCARECGWVARALLVLRLMGVWVVVVVCVGFVRLPECPCLSVR